MVIELDDGRFLHTAYAISNVAEELLPDEWSTTEQGEGMDYVGQYTDDSPVDSDDATDYEWSALYDLDVDDTDDDDVMPVADEQAQIGAIEEQLNILQQDSEDLFNAIEEQSTNIQQTSETSSSAYDIAQATGQHFWTDDNGVHISNQENVAEGERNSLWNSLGMLFRRYANYLLAILVGGADGTGEKGLAIYDGEGNNDGNIVAKFTNEGATIGKESGSHIEQTPESFVLKDSRGGNSFRVTQEEGSSQVQVTEDIASGFTNDVSTLVGQTFTKTLTSEYLGGISVPVSMTFSLMRRGSTSWYYVTVSGIVEDLETTTVTETFRDEDFSGGTISFTVTASFDYSTDTVDVSIDDVVTDLSSDYTFWTVSYNVNATYQTYVLNPVVTIGRYADVTSFPDTVLAIGRSTPSSGQTTANIFRIARDGETNIQGRLASHIDYDETGSTFRTTTVTDSGLITVAHGSYGAYTTSTHTLSGYYPLALQGYYLTGTHATWLNVYQTELVNVAKGSCKVTLGVRDLATSGNASATVKTVVLWAKAS